MNTKQALIAAAIALVGSSAAFAQSSEIDLQHFGADQSSTVSRAEVRSDVLKAQAAGSLVVPGEVLAAAVPARAVVSAPVTRAAVQEQGRIQARRDINKDRATRIGAGY
ncbi:MAG: DUF4148 domain-containing protein [Rhizobacter sp.]